MSRKPITTPEELDALLGGFPQPPARRLSPRAAKQPASEAQAQPVLTLPAPRNGAYYRQGELAETLGVTWSAVHSWIGRGIKVGGKRVKLRTLRAPKGGAAVGAVVEFFRRANGVKVTIGGPPPAIPNATARAPGSGQGRPPAG